MKPNDENGRLPVDQRPFRVLLISGSERRQYNCPGVDSKSRSLMLRMAERLPQEWEIDYEDLGNVYGREKIQSCNACVSTSMALCVWPCNCYEKDSKDEPTSCGTSTCTAAWISRTPGPSSVPSTGTAPAATSSSSSTGWSA